MGYRKSVEEMSIIELLKLHIRGGAVDRPAAANHISYLFGYMQAELTRLKKIEEEYNAGCRYWNPVFKEICDERDQLRADNRKLYDLITTILDEDVLEPVADDGSTVLDAWRKDARHVLGRSE